MTLKKCIYLDVMVGCSNLLICLSVAAWSLIKQPRKIAVGTMEVLILHARKAPGLFPLVRAKNNRKLANITCHRSDKNGHNESLSSNLLKEEF